jgi:hypothetical protein
MEVSTWLFTNDLVEAGPRVLELDGACGRAGCRRVLQHRAVKHVAIAGGVVRQLLRARKKGFDNCQKKEIDEMAVAIRRVANRENRRWRLPTDRLNREVDSAFSREARAFEPPPSPEVWGFPIGQPILTSAPTKVIPNVGHVLPGDSEFFHNKNMEGANDEFKVWQRFGRFHRQEQEGRHRAKCYWAKQLFRLHLQMCSKRRLGDRACP